MGRTRVTGWVLRVLLTVHALMAVAQPVLIGRYLDGDFDRLGDHSTNGSLLVAVEMGCLTVALVHWLVGRGRFWPVAALAGLFFVEGMQISLGFNRNLSVHVPLGVTIVALAVGLAVWAWTPRVMARRGPLRIPGRVGQPVEVGR